MIMVVNENSVPVYELKCCECKSVIRYTKADEHLGRITCPVCNMSNESFAVHPIDHVPKNMLSKDYYDVKPCREDKHCPKCGGEFKLGVVALTGDPPTYSYTCKNCSYTETINLREYKL